MSFAFLNNHVQFRTCANFRTIGVCACGLPQRLSPAAATGLDPRVGRSTAVLPGSDSGKDLTCRALLPCARRNLSLAGGSGAGSCNWFGARRSYTALVNWVALLSYDECRYVLVAMFRLWVFASWDPPSSSKKNLSSGANVGLHNFQQLRPSPPPADET